MKKILSIIIACIMVFCHSSQVLGADAVGTIPGELQVSNMGAAVYTVPVECPDGVNGMKPELAFVYNSHTGEGPMGIGWNIGGLSSIKRTHSDSLTLDGMRLIKKSQSKEGIVYVTESNSYNSITGYEVQSWGPKYFKVFTKEGKTLTYSAFQDEPLSWLLTEVCDSNGNYITYHYDTESLVSNISQISYGKNKSGEGFESVIDFEYELLNSYYVKYQNGKSYVNNKRLKAVKITNNNALWSEYTLNYNNTKITNRSRLQSIECSRGGEKSGFTAFAWIDGEYKIKCVKNPNNKTKDIWNNAVCVAYGDYNGDGVTDRAYYSDGKLIIGQGMNGKIDYERKSDNICSLTFYDVDSDGKQELIIGYRVDTHHIEHEIARWVHNSIYEGFIPEMWGKRSELYCNLYKNQNVSEIAGDFRGDGTIQLIPVLQPQPIIDLLNQLLGRKVSSAGITNQASGDFPRLNIKEAGNKFAVGDVNGNGKSDIIVVDGKNNIHVYEESNGQFEQIMFKYSSDIRDGGIDFSHNSLFPINEVVSEIITGDFNGDGNADIVVMKERYMSGSMVGKCASVYFSTGKELRYTHIGECLRLNNNTNVCVSDVNGDGMSDIFTSDDSAITLYISTGDYLEKVDSMENKELSKELRQFTPVVAEVVTSKTGHKQYLEYLDGILEFSSEACSDRIMMIADNMDNHTHISYSNEAQAGVAVVSRTTVCNTEDCVETNYTYGNVLYDNRFHNYFGFDTVSSVDVVSSRKTVSHYKVEGSSIVLDRTEEFKGKSKLSEVSFSYSAQNIASTKERDELTGIERTVEYKDYDMYGNPQKITVKQGKRTVTKDITYVKAGTWCEAKPSAIKITYNYGGKTDESQHQFTYDDKGNITSDRDDVTITRYQDYDAFGNFRTIVYGEGSDQRTEKFTYTPSGRHIQSKTNAAGETTLYEWDETRGVLLSQTDAYGRKTTYQYDALGRNTVTITPDGNSTEVELKWAEKGNPYNASYYTHAHTSGMGSVTTWYSSNGLELCKSQTGADGRDVYVVKEYKNDGSLQRVSMPSFNKTPEMWAEQYSYDEFGRVSKIQRPEGDAIMSYSGLSVTVNTPSCTSTKVMNAEGLLESMTTNGKKVSYTYYPTGKMKTATPDGGEPVYMEYDKRGNRTLIKEADGGAVKTAYNIFGQVTETSHKQGSGKWVTSIYSYSPEGLLKQINCGGIITDYLYDGHNRLISKTMSDGVSQSYEYDEFDRMTKVTDRIDGKEFVRSTTYDEYGRAVKNTYPSGYFTVNEYGKNGNLFSVKDQMGNEIYRLVNATAMGKVITEYRGGMVTAYEYDAVGNIVSKKDGNRIDHTYSYDKRGNLASFTDNLSHQSCQYEYDALNRLVKWDTYGLGSVDPLKRDSLEYDDANNVTRRSNLGESLMKYEDSNHPHAVSSISGVPETMPKLDQNITYTNFGKVESVTEGDMHYALTYGVSKQRIKSEYATSRGSIVRYYIGSYEEVIGTDGVTTKLCYLPGGAVMMERNGSRTLYYNYTDRLGSIVSTTDAWGNVVEKYAYNPWGERVNPDNWTENDTRTDLLNNRGFTGHEHIDGMSLINMNGRVYDPLIGSFLSLDPFIQAPDFWLNYNRYMYCYGNPLSFVDPSGNSILLALGIGAIIGAAIGTGAGIWYGCNHGYTGWDLAKCALIGAGIGTISGAIAGCYIGSSISSLIAAKTLFTFTQVGASIGGTVGTVGGTIYGLAKKADGWELANYSALGSLVGMVAGMAIGAGCYGLYSYYASASAEYMSQGGVLEILSEGGDMITPGELPPAADVSVTPSISDIQLGDFASSEGGDALSVIKSVGSSSEAAQSVGSSMQVAVGADLNYTASVPSVESGVMQGFWDNSANFISKIYLQPVGNAMRGVALRCTYGAVAVGIGGTTGACFGYHYLTKFIYEYLDPILFGN